MARDYYATLELSSKATEFDICKAYRHLAIQYHPTKYRENQVPILNRFHQLAEAYEILSDPEKRRIYDQAGEFGLKQGIDCKDGGFIGGYSYSGNAYKIFENFFGTINPLYEAYGENSDILKFFNFEHKVEEENQDPPQDLIVEVPCTLAELYIGCQKRIEYKRIVLKDDKMSTATVTEIKTIEIKKGYSKETKVIFYGEGNESPIFPSTQLTFQIVEIPDHRFRRSGNDLIYTVKIPLLNALLAVPIQIVKEI